MVRDFAVRVRFRIASLSAIAMCCASCATLAHGRYEIVSVTSEPPGAVIFFDGHQIGVTPTQLAFPRRRSDIVLQFERPGFETRRIALARGTSKWLIADGAYAANPLACQGLDSASQCPLLIGSALAFLFGIDYLTSAAFTLPKSVHARLSPQG